MSDAAKPLTIADLASDPQNPRTISKENRERLARMMAEYGDLANPTFNRRLGKLVGGHQRLAILREQYGPENIAIEPFAEMGGETQCRLVVAREGREPLVFPLRVVDWDEDKHRAAMVAANSPDVTGEYDAGKLREVYEYLGEAYDVELTGLSLEHVEEWTAPEPADKDGDREYESPDVEPSEGLAEKWGVKAGQLWEVGRHWLMCGDSTNVDAVKPLLDGVRVDAFVTDPPYCSGGFQEAGRATGSIGSKRIGDDGIEYQPRIHNDQLSSRGYCALMKSVLQVWQPSFAYMFTDWRMWVQLFDVMESSGFGVRNMIVWDKGTPGMGRGWRSQHDLVMFGASAKTEFDNHKAVGNVLKSKRTGNPNHPTEKPIDVIVSILGVTDFCRVIADPFCGSGTTMLACEQTGRTCYASEIAPEFAAVTLERMSLIGVNPRLIE